MTNQRAPAQPSRIMGGARATGSPLQPFDDFGDCVETAIILIAYLELLLWQRCHKHAAKENPLDDKRNEPSVPSIKLCVLGGKSVASSH